MKNEFGKIEMKVSGVGVSDKRPPQQAKFVFAKIESAALQKIFYGIREYFGAKGKPTEFDSIFDWQMISETPYVDFRSVET